MLRCFLRYFSLVVFTHVVGGQIESGCPFKILIGDLQVMALGDQLGVAEPAADNVLGVFVRQFRLPRRPPAALIPHRIMVEASGLFICDGG